MRPDARPVVEGLPFVLKASGFILNRRFRMFERRNPGSAPIPAQGPLARCVQFDKWTNRRVSRRFAERLKSKESDRYEPTPGIESMRTIRVV